MRDLDLIQMTMKLNFPFSPKKSLLILLGIVFFCYCLFQARFIILGPQVSITSPEDGETLASSIVLVTGKAHNAAWISLNGRQIFTDENGLWEEKLIVSPGTSIMTVTVRDRFGRESEESVRIIFK